MPPDEPPKKQPLPDPEPGSLIADILDIRKQGRAAGSKKRDEHLKKLYPKPDEGEVKRIKSRLESHWTRFRANAQYIREYRYHEDRLPAKWQLDLTDGRRGWMNLSNNEINWCVANALRNPIVVTIPPTDVTDKAQGRADRQERWANALQPACERKQIFMHPSVDQQHECGLGGFLFYWNDAYDQIDFERQKYGEVEVPEDEMVRDAIEAELVERDIEFELSESGKKWEIKESASDYRRRTNAELEHAGLPFGFRFLDMTSTYFEDDGERLTLAVVCEQKPWPAIRQAVMDKVDEDEKAFVPPVSQHGSPEFGGYTFNGDSVECITYYDRRWYAYIVAGKVIEIKEHKLPRIPLFPLYGIVTSATDPCDRYQGVVHGMQHMEQFVNDAYTLMLNSAMKYGDPKFVLEEIDPAIWATMDESIKATMKIDLSGNDNQVTILPGKLRNTSEHISPNPLLSQLMQQGMQTWERNGLNQVATGESPGADMAGYSLHTLQQASLAKYRPYLINIARAWGEAIDFVRLVIRDVIGEKVYLVAEQESGSESGREILALGPDDIGDEISPAECYIDPLSEPNRAAMQQIMMAAHQNGSGFVPWDVVVRRAFGAKDPALWRAMLLEDRTINEVLWPAYAEQLTQLLKGAPPQDVQAQMMAAMGGQQPPGMPPVGGGPNNMAQTLPGQVQQSGGTPSPLQPPAGVPAPSQAGQQPMGQGRAQTPGG